MSRFAGVVGVLLTLAAAAGFAALNSVQRVTIDLGFMVLYRVPVTVVAFGGLFSGMVVMLVAGLNSDLKVRAILRERLREEAREEERFIDPTQQDLFEPTDRPGRKED